MGVIRTIVLCAVASLAAPGQPAPARPEFEVASIRPSPAPAPGQVNVGIHIDGAQVNCSFLSLKDYIRMAYRLKHQQISGPDWIASARFDIAAKLPTSAARDQVPDMLQALLEDRFQLKLHRDTKDLSVYGLVVTKGGTGMKESPASGDAPYDSINVTASGGRGGATLNLPGGASFSIANNRFEARKLTMPGFADTLERFLDRPVVDMTQLIGKYDFTLEFTPEDFRALMIRSAVANGVAVPPEALQLMSGASGDSLFTALQTLGLKLSPRKTPVEVLVIDAVERVPSAN
jgi:uncharacterized protein (TIGR03435 family)